MSQLHRRLGHADEVLAEEAIITETVLTDLLDEEVRLPLVVVQVLWSKELIVIVVFIITFIIIIIIIIIIIVVVVVVVVVVVINVFKFITILLRVVNTKPKTDPPSRGDTAHHCRPTLLHRHP